MSSYCQYKHALGVPGKGFHTHFGGVAWGDVIGTILIAWLIVHLTHWDFSLVSAVLFFAAFGLHKVFCVYSK
jgi:hypothetical protein